MYDARLIPSPLEFVNCSISKSVSIGKPPVCWLTDRAIFCFCRSMRSFSRADRNCSKSSSVRLSSTGVLAVVQSTCSSPVLKTRNHFKSFKFVEESLEISNKDERFHYYRLWLIQACPLSTHLLHSHGFLVFASEHNFPLERMS